MKLTAGQQQLITACAKLDIRPKSQTLSLLLLEGVSMYFFERNVSMDEVHKAVEIVEAEIKQQLEDVDFNAPEIQ